MEIWEGVGLHARWPVAKDLQQSGNVLEKYLSSL